jgi:hypothetical protein
MTRRKGKATGSTTPALTPQIFPRKLRAMPCREKLSEFNAWCQSHITGDEKGQAQIFLDRLFQAFGQPGCLDVGGTTEFRIRKDKEDGGGTAFADYVWKPVVLIEMKKRGTDLQKHYRQAFDYWTRLVPNRPRYATRIQEQTRHGLLLWQSCC